MQPSGIRTDDANVFELSRQALDDLPFGVIALDRSGAIVRYNRAAARLSRRQSIRTLGLHFFNDIAPCTNVGAFRGRFDAFARSWDAGIERFTFGFAFRWGRQDVSITMLRRAGHPEITLLVRDRVAARDPDENLNRSPVGSALRRSAETLPALPVGAKALPSVARIIDAADPLALRDRVHPDDLLAVEAIISAAAHAGTPYAVQYRGNGAGHEQRIFVEHGYFESGANRVCHATARDVTAQLEREVETERVAYFDPLTGLPNRELLLVRIAAAIASAQANGRVAGVAFANLDEFRQVNDTFGHDIGDELLRTVAARLSECVRTGDTVARIAADGFVVVFADVDTPPSITEAARRMIACVAQPFMLAGHAYYLTLRVGISVTPHDGNEPLPLLRAAEAALFAAKASPRNSLRSYSSQVASDAVSNLARQNEMRAALENDEFVLLYQPLIDLELDRVVAAEALVRWQHPTRGMLSPLEFIPLADRTGLIVPLGEWVLRTACRQARSWLDSGRDLRICVNVSAVQFARPDFVDVVASIVEEFHLPPARLELELTESIMVDGFDAMMQTLNRLKRLGLRLAIDDFGTGYSSLSYLKHFPIDTLKVDRAFINDISSDHFDQAIATAIFTLTQSLNLECVIEGVETPEQLATLRNIGCSVVQGYYFGRPASPDQLGDCLKMTTPPTPMLAPAQ